MHRKLLLLLTIALVIGCDDEKPTVKIGISVPETTAPVYTLMKQAMIEHEKEYGVKIVWNGVTDEGDKKDAVKLEMQQIRTMLAAGIRSLIIYPVDGKNGYPILKAARRWHVPVISLDEMLVGIPVWGHIAVNEIGLGEAAAQYAVKKSGYKGNVLVLEGPPKVESMRNIAIGIYRILEQYPDEIRVFSRTSTLNPDGAFDLTNLMLKNYARNIQAIIAVDSTIAVGAVRAAELHGLTDLIITVGVGAGEEACRQIINRQHDAEVDLMPYERGLEALKVAVDALNDRSFSYDSELPNGELMAKTRFGPIRRITSANYLVLKQMWPGLFVED
jgi:ABC-type sugar transport system substrate-binding protein